MIWREDWSTAMEGALEQCRRWGTGEVHWREDWSCALEEALEQYHGRRTQALQLRLHGN